MDGCEMSKHVLFLSVFRITIFFFTMIETFNPCVIFYFVSNGILEMLIDLVR